MPVSSRDPSAIARHGGRLVCLDGWRGLAIALVLLGHFMPIPGWTLESAGVEMFFVLSGRLIAQMLFLDATPLGRFLWRRIGRVAPALVVFVALAGALQARLGHGWPDPLPVLTFTANYAYAAAGEPLFFGHLWSLCVEEHSYLALVLVALLHRAWGGPAATSVALLAGVCFADLAFSELVLGQRDYVVLWRTDARAWALLASAALTVGAGGRLGPSKPGTAFRFVPVAALAGGLALFVDGVPQLVQYGLGGLALALAVNTLEAAPARVLEQMTSPPFRALARWSYSVYLWQQPFFVLAYLMGPAWRLPLLVAAASAGLASFHLVERPSRTGFNALWGRFERRRSAPPVPAPL